MAKVKKTFGENPEKIVVLDQVVEFDEKGEAEVDEAVAEVLEQLPGYVFEEAESTSEDDNDSEDEGTSEDEAPTPKKPTPRAPKKPAPKSTPKA